MQSIQENSKCFLVKESRILDTTASLILWIMFFLAIYYGNFRGSTPGMNVTIIYLTIIPAIFFFIRAVDNRSIIEINEKGFYYYGSLITSWENFISANYSQEEMDGNISDNFVLFIEHYKQDNDVSYVSKIPLTSTQNKSEEEIINAIRQFSKK